MPSISRRDFLKGAFATAATAVVTTSLPSVAFADDKAAEVTTPSLSHSIRRITTLQNAQSMTSASLNFSNPGNSDL